MQCFIACLLIIFYACYALADTSTPESPYGLTFTPTTVVASRFNASGSIELTKYPLGPEYLESYRIAVQEFDNPTKDYQISDRAAAETLFRSAITPLTEVLSRQLGYAPEYAALFFPSVFSFAARSAAVTGVLGDHGNRPMKDGIAAQATCQAYGFLEGKNLGRLPELCVEEGPVNLVIVLEYEEDFLYVWLREVAFELEICPAIQDEICKECGQAYRKHIGTVAYRDRVSTFLTAFVERILQDHQRDSIRAIISSGEASPTLMTELSLIVRDAVGSESARILTHVNPLDVVPRSAAVWARRVQREAWKFMIVGGNVLDYETSHGEL